MLMNLAQSDIGEHELLLDEFSAKQKYMCFTCSFVENRRFSELLTYLGTQLLS